MFIADPPAVIVAAPAAQPADVVVVSRDSHSDILVSTDTPLPLIKGRKTEDAILRQVIFMTCTLIVVRPAAGPGQDVLRWTYQPFMQRQLCLTSITGLFSCAGAEVEDMTEKAEGEAPIPAAAGQTAPGPNPAAEAVRIALVADLNTRSAALFEADRRLNVTPMLKAAGVSIRRLPSSAGSRR